MRLFFLLFLLLVSSLAFAVTDIKTYKVSDNNFNRAYSMYSDGKPPFEEIPPTTAPNSTQFSVPSYNKTRYSDNSSFFVSNAGNWSNIDFQINITQPKADITQIDIFFEGYAGELENGSRMYIYNFVTAKWDWWKNQSNNSKDEPIHVSFTAGAQINNYIGVNENGTLLWAQIITNNSDAGFPSGSPTLYAEKNGKLYFISDFLAYTSLLAMSRWDEIY